MTNPNDYPPDTHARALAERLALAEQALQSAVECGRYDLAKQRAVDRLEDELGALTERHS